MDSDYKQAQSVSSESSARNNAIMIQMKDLVALGKAEQAAHMKTKQLFADAANRAETSQKELEETTVLKQLLEEQNSEVEKQNKALLGDIAQKAQKLAAMEKAAVVAAAEMSDANVLKQDLLKEKETLEKRNSDLAVALEKSQTELGALKYKLLTAESEGRARCEKRDAQIRKLTKARNAAVVPALQSRAPPTNPLQQLLHNTG